MKKKLCSLLIAVFVIGTCVMLPISASAEIAPLTPFEFRQDFEDEAIEVGENYAPSERVTTSEFLGLPLSISKNTASSNVSLTVMQEDDGNKVMRVLTSEQSDSVTSIYALGTPVTAGKFEASYEFGPEAGKGAWHMLALYNASSNVHSTITIEGTTWRLSSDTLIGKLNSSPQKNAKGRYALHLIATRSGSDEPWKIEIYDESGDNPTLFYEGETDKNFGAITSVRLFNVYAMGTGWPGIFDNFNVKATYLPTVVPENDGLRGAEPDSDVMTIRFNGAIPDANEQVTLVKADDPTVIIEADTTYDATTGEMTIAPKSYLEYGTEYKAVFASGGVTNHVFTTAAAPVSVTQKTVTYTPAGGSAQETMPETGTFDVSCNVEISNSTNANKFFTVMLVAYGENGSVLQSSIRNGIRVRNENTNSASRTLSGLDASKIASVDVIVWEEADGVGYRPVG